MEEEIIQALLADSGFQAVFSTRLYPAGAPQKQKIWPIAVFRVISIGRDINMAGDNEYRDSIAQIDVWATTYRQAKEGSRAIADALHGKAFTKVMLIKVGSDRDDRDRLNNETDLFRVTQDLEVKHCK